MRTILDKVTKGKRRVVVELDEGEVLLSVKPNCFYRLSDPLEDQIMASHVVDHLTRVVWCSFEQKWIDA